jgi:hypothetical protein
MISKPQPKPQTQKPEGVGGGGERWAGWRVAGRKTDGQILGKVSFGLGEIER